VAGSSTYYLCAGCKDRIGVYEPIWLQHTDGTLATTSLLNLDPRLRMDEDPPRLFHLGCLAPDAISQTNSG
jgi:hypothetical protein